MHCKYVSHLYPNVFAYTCRTEIEEAGDAMPVTIHFYGIAADCDIVPRSGYYKKECSHQNPQDA